MYWNWGITKLDIIYNWCYIILSPTLGWGANIEFFLTRSNFESVQRVHSIHCGDIHTTLCSRWVRYTNHLTICLFFLAVCEGCDWDGRRTTMARASRGVDRQRQQRVDEVTHATPEDFDDNGPRQSRRDGSEPSHLSPSTLSSPRRRRIGDLERTLLGLHKVVLPFAIKYEVLLPVFTPSRSDLSAPLSRIYCLPTFVCSRFVSFNLHTRSKHKHESHSNSLGTFSPSCWYPTLRSRWVQYTNHLTICLFFLAVWWGLWLGRTTMARASRGFGSTTTTTMSMRLRTGSRRQKTLTTMARVNHAETNTYIYE